MNKKILVVLKNPPVSFMVDGIIRKKSLKGIKNLGCFQEGLALYIPYSVDSNIAYIQEMSEDDVKTMEEKILKQRAQLEIVKPGFRIPKKRTN